ncbi:hypothetical protein D9M72_650910 [compost metagenome]
MPLGWADNPVEAHLVRQKYWRNMEFAGTVGPERAAQALAMLDNLENVEDVSPLAASLVR